MACLAVFAVSFALTGVIMGTSDGGEASAGYAEHKAEQAETAVSVQTEMREYVVREHNGKIAVFSNGFQTTPMLETDIPTDGLRETDRQMLRDGIEAASYEDVIALLEDLGS